MIKSIRSTLLILVAVFYSPAFAQKSFDGVTGAVNSALSSAAVNLIQPKIMGWLAAFLTIQFVLTNIRKLIHGADLQEAIAKAVGMFFSAGMCLLAVNYGPEFIDKVGNDLLGHFLSSIPSVSAIISSTLAMATVIIAAAFGASVINDAMANILVGMFWIVAGGGVYLACKVFMFYLELGMIIILAPLSFALLGLDALRDQGIAPLRSLISLVYRAVLFGVIFAAYSYVADNATQSFQSISWENPLAIIKNIGKVIDALMAYPVLLFLAFKSDSIAASLASGSTSMGTADVAQAAAIGAAAGATVATAGSATTSAAGNAAKSMSDFMGRMAGGGSISNASPMGIGGGDAPSFTPPPPSMSAGSKISSDPRKPPARPVASGRYGPPLRGDLGYAPETAAPAQNGPAPAGNATSAPASQPGTDGAKVSPASQSTAIPSGQPLASSATTAGIGGVPGNNSVSPQESAAAQGPRKPTVGELLGETNRHMAQEQAATHISINTHSD